jgi:DNA polymerase elongation subunit (family B)
MLKHIKPEKVLFLDIETVPEKANFNDLSPEKQEFWEIKSQQFRKDGQTAKEVYQRAGIYAEFGKIICISFGIFHQKDSGRHIRIKSFYNDDERVVLREFAHLLVKLNEQNDLLLCAHNGKEFDFPYISRRMLVHGIDIPTILNVSSRKPWETPFLDTMEMWKFGDHKHYTSLNLLTHLFNIPSPKADIDGSMVAEVYWVHNDLERIATYCQNDVLAIMQLFLKFRNEETIPADKVEFK